MKQTERKEDQKKPNISKLLDFQRFSKCIFYSLNLFPLHLLAFFFYQYADSSTYRLRKSSYVIFLDYFAHFVSIQVFSTQKSKTDSWKPTY